MRNKLTALSILLLLAVTPFACDDGPRDDDGGSDSDTDSDSDFEWCDVTTSLCWQLESVYYSDWYESVSGCEDLSLGGHEDWYLPDIDELRSLIRGCPVTETGGECPIVDGSDSGDFDTICLGCDFLGNSSHSRGCYWDEGMEDLCTSPEGHNWSSSEDDFYASSDRAWYLDFDEGAVRSTQKDNSLNTRCVRTMD